MFRPTFAVLALCALACGCRTRPERPAPAYARHAEPASAAAPAPVRARPAAVAPGAPAPPAGRLCQGATVAPQWLDPVGTPRRRLVLAHEVPQRPQDIGVERWRGDLDGDGAQDSIVRLGFPDFAASWHDLAMAVLIDCGGGRMAYALPATPAVDVVPGEGSHAGFRDLLQLDLQQQQPLRFDGHGYVAAGAPVPISVSGETAEAQTQRPPDPPAVRDLCAHGRPLRVHWLEPDAVEGRCFVALDEWEDGAGPQGRRWRGDLDGDGAQDDAILDFHMCGNEGECVFAPVIGCADGHSVFAAEPDYAVDLAPRADGARHGGVRDLTITLRTTVTDRGGVSTKAVAIPKTMRFTNGRYRRPAVP